VVGNLVAILFIKRVHVDPKGYILKEGFPLFVSAEEYLRLVRTYPHDMGTKVKIHTMRPGESYWDVARANCISVDTIVAANPFIQSLAAREGSQIVVPLADGVLVPVDNIFDVYRMKRILGRCGGAGGEYMHSVFRLLSTDDMRFAFFRDARPCLVNGNLQALYNIRKIFQSPIRGGMYSSLYGDRVDPMREGTAFHNGVDIQVRMGTPIYPVREGIVTHTGWQDGYGLTIVVQHAEGYISMYGHCSGIAVKKGQRVEKDRVIGRVGSTGRSTGPHLHFMMMRHGRMLNPLLFIW
jgi:murein DD-endopeptidase MepM/ murein hydrolase activator NlpD